MAKIIVFNEWIYCLLTLRVCPVRRVLRQLAAVVLEQHLVPGDPLDGRQHVVLQRQLTALGHGL